MARFLARVEPVGDCLLWTGDLDKDGYPVLKVKVNGRWVPKPAHVWIWEQVHGPVPAGHSLDHVCHTFDDTCRGRGRLCPHRRCVRIDHLEPVTPAEQSRRARERTGAMSDLLAALQLRLRLPHALEAYQDGETHLTPDDLHARLAARGLPYSLWKPADLLTALDPGGEGVRPTPSGYERVALLDRLNELVAEQC